MRMKRKHVLPFALLILLGGCLHGCQTTTWRVGLDGEVMGQVFRIEAIGAVVVEDCDKELNDDD